MPPPGTLLRQAWRSVTGLFLWGGRINRPLLAVFGLMNAVVLFNAYKHPARVGYDAEHHLKYISTLADQRLPTREDTDEFFSPPLPYALPALGKAAFDLKVHKAAKLAQFTNVFLSLGLSLLLISICRMASPAKPLLPTLVLFSLAMLPVYYKSFAFVRGEPLIAFFTIATLWAWQYFDGRDQLKSYRALASFGALSGLLVLSRQWGLFTAVAAALFGLAYACKQKWRLHELARAVIIVGFVGLAFGGWYYLHLLNRHGSVTAFNRQDRHGLSLENQPLAFYTGTGWPAVVERPLRPAFTNQLIPTFYSETWGDYWCYFSVWARESGKLVRSGYTLEKLLSQGKLSDSETNYETAGKYFGRVNALASIPTAFLLLGWIAGLGCFGRFLLSRGIPSPRCQMRALAALIVAVSLIGYLWFLIKFPKVSKGNTIKATYMLQVFPLTAFLMGCCLHDLHERWPRISIILIAMLAAVAMHNVGGMITAFR